MIYNDSTALVESMLTQEGDLLDLPRREANRVHRLRGLRQRTSRRTVCD